MSESQSSDVIAEEFLRELSKQLTAPAAGECLLCYLCRVIGEFGCNGTLRWSMCWREAQPQRPRAFQRRLERQGGYCDCEVIMNVYRHYPEDEDPSAALPCPHQL